MRPKDAYLDLRGGEPIIHFHNLTIDLAPRRKIGAYFRFFQLTRRLSAQDIRIFDQNDNFMAYF